VQQPLVNPLPQLSSQQLQNQTQSYSLNINTNQFKIPLTSPSTGYKVFHFPVMESQKQPGSPQQQPVVTSTSSPALDAPGKIRLPVQIADSPVPSTGILRTVNEVKLAFKTVSVPSADLSPAIPTTGTLLTVSSSNPPFHHDLPVTLSTPVDQCLSVVTTTPGTAHFVEGHRTVGIKVPPLDFSVKKDDLQSTSTQTPSSSKRQLSASFIVNDCATDFVPQSFPSPNKMLRLSFNMQNEMFQKSSLDNETDGLLKCSESKSHLSVIVEDLSNKPSTSTTVVTTSTAQTGNKDMWRPW
jgi:hypothetical protein